MTVQAETPVYTDSGLKELAMAFIPWIEEFYKDPQHIREFERWKEKRDQEAGR